jgi:hypothetical protein
VVIVTVPIGLECQVSIVDTVAITGSVFLLAVEPHQYPPPSYPHFFQPFNLQVINVLNRFFYIIVISQKGLKQYVNYY